MAKAKSQATEEIVETLQDNNFDDEPAAHEAPQFTEGAYAERKDFETGKSVADSMQTIREARARARALRGPARKRRVITNYHDAERLHNLATGAIAGMHRDSDGRPIRGSNCTFPGVATAEELVEAEEAGLLPNPEHYATGSTAAVDNSVPPDEAA